MDTPQRRDRASGKYARNGSTRRSKFTPWLADNLHLLGDELGMNLELVQMEKPVGPYSLDILAKEANEGVLVAIENQLEETDPPPPRPTGSPMRPDATRRSQYGSRRSFATNMRRPCTVSNKWTKENIRFFGVKVEVFKKAGGDLEPRFRKVVYPGGWNKEATLPSGENARDQAAVLRFLPTADYQAAWSRGFANKAVNHWGHTGRLFPSGFDEETGLRGQAFRRMAHGYLSMFERGTALIVTIGYSTNCKKPNLRSKSSSTPNGYGRDSPPTLSSK